MFAAEAAGSRRRPDGHLLPWMETGQSVTTTRLPSDHAPIGFRPRPAAVGLLNIQWHVSAAVAICHGGQAGWPRSLAIIKMGENRLGPRAMLAYSLVIPYMISVPLRCFTACGYHRRCRVSCAAEEEAWEPIRSVGPGMAVISICWMAAGPRAYITWADNGCTCWARNCRHRSDDGAGCVPTSTGGAMVPSLQGGGRSRCWWSSGRHTRPGVARFIEFSGSDLLVAEEARGAACLHAGTSDQP